MDNSKAMKRSQNSWSEAEPNNDYLNEPNRYEPNNYESYYYEPNYNNVHQPDDEPEYEEEVICEPPVHHEVQVLLLTFEFHDLEEAFDLETDEVEEAFTRLGYEVSQFEIPMTDSLPRLQEKQQQFFSDVTEDTLAIIYYHGHAGRDDGSLVLSRYSTRNSITHLNLAD